VTPEGAVRPHRELHEAPIAPDDDVVRVIAPEELGAEVEELLAA
jgi:hypothetical protein